MAKQQRSPTFAAIAAQAKLAPEPGDAWDIVYFQRHNDDDQTQRAPGRDYLHAIPSPVRAHSRNVLIAVAKAPPTKFAGGGYWEAMKDDMTGYYEVRKKYADEHYRLFCVLDSQAEGADPLLVVLCGMTKPDRTVFSDAEYASVRALGEEYLARQPRSLYEAQSASS